MKKICFITTTSLTLKTFVVDTAKYLHEHGEYDITFICDHNEAFARELPEYINFTPVAMSRGVNLSGFSSICKFIKIFREEKFDIVQYSTPNASLYASIAAKVSKVPQRLYCQWGIRYVGFDGMARKLFKALEKLVCANSTAVRAVSPMNMVFAVAEGLYHKEKAKVLGKGGTIGVDLAEYPLAMKSEWRDEIRQKYDIAAPVVFGFAGRLSRDKGGNELLAAFKALSAQRNDVALLIVGPNEAGNDVDAKLLAWAKQSKQVTFTGMVSKIDMPKHYAAMNVLVHPTYREGFGMVLQEAAAMEIAVLTTRIPGASEVLVDGESCLLCEAKDYKDLKKYMEQLADPSTAARLAVNARKYTEKNYERSIMLRHQFEDYESM